MSVPIDQKLKQILVCPACKSEVKETASSLVCQNPECRLEYPIRNNIPVMLISEAKKAKG